MKSVHRIHGINDLEWSRSWMDNTGTRRFPVLVGTGPLTVQASRAEIRDLIRSGAVILQVLQERGTDFDRRRARERLGWGVAP